jgi:hypothetical protein
MKRSIAIAAALGAALALVGGPGALAKDGDVRKSGACSDSSTWKLKLSDENSKIETEFEVDQNVTGDDWKVVLKKDGEVFFRGTKTTKGRSGSFEVRKLVNDGSGTEKITGHARNVDTDELCHGHASWK